jgi:16S rRNA (guanine966-N2)-methyltransferase
MRITGGEYRGRTLEAPKGRDIRPTSDKVRLAIFNMLNSRGLVEDAVVLDAFCGTGALGIEALSWGASMGIFMDKARESLELCKKNCSTLKLEPVKHLLKDATKPGERIVDLPAADLIFLDPPYRMGLVEQSLSALEKNGWLAEKGHAVLIETESRYDASWLIGAGYEISLTKDYGDTQVMLAQK